MVHESESPYAFVSGNPILYADPSGAEGEIQEFTSPIQDPNENPELTSISNRTVINYNGQTVSKHNDKWTYHIAEKPGQAASYMPIPTELASLTQDDLVNMPLGHQPGSNVAFGWDEATSRVSVYWFNGNNWQSHIPGTQSERDNTRMKATGEAVDALQLALPVIVGVTVTAPLLVPSSVSIGEAGVTAGISKYTSVFGGIVNAGLEAYKESKEGNYTPWKIGVAFGTGFISGGLGKAAMLSQSRTLTPFLGAASGVTFNLGNSLISGDKITTERIVTDVVVGGTIGAVTGVMSSGTLNYINRASQYQLPLGTLANQGLQLNFMNGAMNPTMNFGQLFSGAVVGQTTKQSLKLISSEVQQKKSK